MKKLTDSVAWNTVRVLLVIVSLLKMFIPAFDLYFEEELMGFLNVFDSNLFVWIIYIWILGQTLKKANMPKWMPPVPVLLLLASITICTLFGWSHTTADGAKAIFQATIEYGLLNGILVWLVSCTGYDFGKSVCNWEGLKNLLADIKKWFKNVVTVLVAKIKARKEAKAKAKAEKAEKAKADAEVVAQEEIAK